MINIDAFEINKLVSRNPFRQGPNGWIDKSWNETLKMSPTAKPSGFVTDHNQLYRRQELAWFVNSRSIK